MIKFSIIVPIYNVEQYLEKCLESIIGQTYKNIEIILINDGSKDNSDEICKKFKKIDKRIKYVKKENGGLSSARNEGMKYASGDYLIFVDSDDYISLELCEKAKNIINDTGADLIQYEFQKFIDGKLALEINEKGYTIMATFDSSNSFDNYLTKEIIKREAWSKVYKKELFKGIIYPEGRIAEDLATTYKIVNKANKIICISDKLYFYRLRNNSIMGKGSLKLYYDAMLAHYEIYLDCLSKERKYLVKSYSNYYNNFLKLYSKNVLENGNISKEELEKRYKEIKYNDLNFKSKIVYIIGKINKRMMLKIIYNKYVK